MLHSTLSNLASTQNSRTPQRSILALQQCGERWPSLLSLFTPTLTSILCLYLSLRGYPFGSLQYRSQQSSSTVYPQKGRPSPMIDPGKAFLQTLEMGCGSFGQEYESLSYAIWWDVWGSGWSGPLGLTCSFTHGEGCSQKRTKMEPLRLCYPKWQLLTTCGF